MEKISEAGYTTYKNHRAEPYFSFVKNGQKTIEGRIKKELYGLIKEGDRIIIYNKEETDSFEVVVKGTRNYLSFKEMLENEPLDKVLPDAKNMYDGLEIYNRFYTKEQEGQYGVVAIEVERL